MHKRSVKKWVWLGLGLVFAYILLGATLPFLHHKPPSSQVVQQFDPLSVYGNQPSTQRVAAVNDNTDALLWRLRIIEAAQQRIAYSSFDFGDDQSGRDVIAALYAAAQRGVQVQVIVDGLTSIFDLVGSDAFAALAAHPNVQLRRYNTLDLIRPWSLQGRLHDKYLLADDFVYLAGGRNTYDLFLGDYSQGKNSDRELLVYDTDPSQSESSSVAQLWQHFQGMWAQECNKEYAPSATGGAAVRGQQALQARYQQLKAAYPQCFTPTDWVGATLPTNKITLLESPLEPNNKAPDLWYMLYQVMATGQQVVIQTPYVICSDYMYSTLTDLASRVESVSIVTNAVESGANPWGCSDYLNQKRNVWATGAKVYEFLGPHSSHTKTMLVDDRLSIVGSYNLDMRSTYLSTELMLVVDSEALNAQLQADAQAEMRQSKLALGDGSYEHGPEFVPRAVPWPKQLFYTLLRVLILPLRHML